MVPTFVSLIVVFIFVSFVHRYVCQGAHGAPAHVGQGQGQGQGGLGPGSGWARVRVIGLGLGSGSQPLVPQLQPQGLSHRATATGPQPQLQPQGHSHRATATGPQLGHG